ncbi:MAG: hypothetical protein J6T35_02200 [Bacteroidales bacterium]|nr:hypothetical protein [Bacteroidales bacterium]
MTRAEKAANKAYPNKRFIDESYADMCRSFYKDGYEQAEQNIISIIKSRIGEILGDAQPAPILRAELNELIKRIKQ